MEDLHKRLAAIQAKCKELGIGYDGYPMTGAQVDWLSGQVEELRLLIDNYQGLKVIQSS